MKKIYTLLLAAAVGAATAGAQQTVFIGTTGYDDLPSAVAAAVSGDVITIKGETTLEQLHLRKYYFRRHQHQQACH